MNFIKLPKLLIKAVVHIVLMTFTVTLSCPAPSYAQGKFTISRAIGSQAPLEILPLDLKGLTVHPDNPGQLDFILDSRKDFIERDVKEDAVRLFKYFLAALTIPQDDIWVNLSPYEHDRMIPIQFSYTEMGRDFLIEDYALKQLTASLIYPESRLGKEFWNKIYQKAYRLYGTTSVPINTFNKVWIVPDKPAVYVRGHEVFVIRNHLKVLSEQDFLASSKYFGSQESHIRKNLKTGNVLNALSADVVKEIVIPEIERQVNESPDFLKLRQIYQTMILATWYKKNLRDNILGKIYLDQNKILGVDIKDRQEKEKIYRQYLSIFKKGVFNFIKEDYDSNTKQLIPRKYFAGGLQGVKEVTEKTDLARLSPLEKQGLPSNQAMKVTADLQAVSTAEPPDQRANPYGMDARHNVSRDCFMELDPAYDIFNLLDERSKEKQKLLLLGVGRGVSAVELALRYPDIEIWAVNKEANLWDDEIIGQIMESKGYNKQEISEARSRIKVLAFDAVDVEQRDRVLGNQKFDMVFFEPRTQIYFEDKVGPVEGFFNRFVKVGGEYGFVSNSIFSSQEAFVQSDFGSPLYERNPDPLAVELTKDAFSSKAELKFWKKLGGNLYLRFKRTTAGDVHIPLIKVHNERFTTPLGLPLVWSIYQPEISDAQLAAASDTAMVSRASSVYASESEFFDSLILSTHPFSTNPILLFAGDPGSGKTTLAQQYKAYLESRGQSAVIINTDKLFNTKALMLKQGFLIPWLKVPFISAATRMRIFNQLLIDSDRVRRVAQQIRDINTSSKKEGIIQVDGLPEMVINPGTVIIIEGSLANRMFGEQLPITKKVYFKIAPQLQQQRIVKRAVEVRGYSPLKAKVAARLLSADVFKKIFESGIEDYDAVMETNEEGQSIVSVKDRAMQSPDIENVQYITHMDDLRNNLGKSKYSLNGKIGHNNNNDSFAYASQVIANALSVDGGNYFKTNHVTRVAIGFDADISSRENALKMARILAASNIAVTLVDEETQPFMLAELTRKGLKAENKYDLAFHISRGGFDNFNIRIFENGITAYQTFLDFLKISYFTYDRNGYREYKNTDLIPTQLFRSVKVKNELKERLAVFDVESLKKEIPAFLEAMKRKGVLNVEAEGIEKLLSSYGLDAPPIGSLNLNFDLEGAITNSSADIDGSGIDMISLAVIFIHYLHSIGQPGEVVQSLMVPSFIERIANVLGIRVSTVGMGALSLLDYPDAMFGLLANGYIQFNYQGEHFISSPAAERLLALEIMLKSKMTLGEYLDSIAKEMKETKNAQASLKASTEINGSTYTMKVPFSKFKEKLDDFFGSYENGFSVLGRMIGREMDWFSGDYRVLFNTETDHQLVFSIQLSFLNGNKVTIKARYATSEKDTLRLYVETSAGIDPQAVIKATQRALFQLLGKDNFDEQKPVNSLSDEELRIIKGIMSGLRSGLDLSYLKDIKILNLDDKDKAMSSYGGISFQSQFMDLDVQGGIVKVNLTAHQPFGSDRVEGIIPIIISVKRYAFNLNDS